MEGKLDTFVQLMRDHIDKDDAVQGDLDSRLSKVERDAAFVAGRRVGATTTIAAIGGAVGAAAAALLRYVTGH